MGIVDQIPEFAAEYVAESSPTADPRDKGKAPQDLISCDSDSEEEHDLLNGHDQRGSSDDADELSAGSSSVYGGRASSVREPAITSDQYTARRAIRLRRGVS